MVQLAELTEPALVPQAVAAALGVREAPGQTALERVGMIWLW
jgi:predicted ATPase